MFRNMLQVLTSIDTGYFTLSRNVTVDHKTKQNLLLIYLLHSTVCSRLIIYLMQQKTNNVNVVYIKVTYDAIKDDGGI